MALEIGNVRDRLVDAALRVLRDEGATSLTVRRIADAAGSSTMGIYSRFGSRERILEAVYLRGFEMLRSALAEVGDGPDVPGQLVDLGLACRGFALGNPALYGLMFERPVPGFDPALPVRQEALRMTFGYLVGAVQRGIDTGLIRDGDASRTSYLLWCVVHGVVSLELTHAARGPVAGSHFARPEDGASMLVDAVSATIAGLRAA